MLATATPCYYMKKSVLIVINVILAVGLFSFIKREPKVEANKHSMILGMVLLEDPNSFSVSQVVTDLRNRWQLKVDDTESGDEASVLVIDGYKVAIGNMPVPIPGDEIRQTAQYNYLWPDGEQEAVKHKAHLIVSLMSAGKDPIAENLLFNKVISSILNQSKSLGVYVGGRSLLLSKAFYLANTETMSREDLPLYNWVYFGLRSENGKQSVYTYGLADFNKKEMEIIDSPHSLEELSGMMFNMAHYVIAHDVTLQHGETIGISAEQKLKITESKGKYLEGNTLKIKY